MNSKHIFLIMSLFITDARLSAHTPRAIFMVIHGTWARESGWYKQGGDFFQALTSSAALYQCDVISFSWSGNLDNPSRTQAGKELAQCIHQLPSHIPLIIVAHSHGTSVALLACQIVEEQEHLHHIEIFSLGSPIVRTCTCTCKLALTVIKKIYNLFSCNDFVQPVGGMFVRLFPEHHCVANIRLLLNGKEPGHTQMHDPLIGHWIPLIYMASTQSPTLFTALRSALLYLDDNAPPRYHHDYQREQVMEQDAWVIQQLATVFRKKLTPVGDFDC